jgi:hypothetical protein
MKQVIRLAVLAGAALALSACGTAPTTLVNHDQMYLPVFPSLLTAHTTISPPPDKDAYLAANSDQQKTMWRQAWQTQTQNVLTCNIDKDSINSWYAQQSAAVAAANSASGAAAASAPVAASSAQAKQ